MAILRPLRQIQTVKFALLAIGAVKSVQVQHPRAILVLRENITLRKEALKNQVACHVMQGIITAGLDKQAKIHAKNVPLESTKATTVPCSAWHAQLADGNHPLMVRIA